MTEPDESPTLRQPAQPETPTWVGSAAVPPGGSRRRRQWEDTLDLPAAPRTVPLPPEPAGPPAPPLPQPPKRSQRSQPPQVRYVPVPPRYGPPPGYAPPPQYRPRRRKWPWVMLLLFTLCAGCCGGSYAWARPYWQEYPASVRVEATVPGLTRTTDGAAKKNATDLQKALTSDQLDESGFTVTYQDASNRQLRVFVAGATRFITDPTGDLEASIRKVPAQLQVGDVKVIDPGPFGGQQRCAAAHADGRPATLCGWSDHGVIALAVFPGRSLEQASTLTQQIRGSIVVRG